MNYKVIDKEKYYRKGVFDHFTQDCKCSTSMTARIDVTKLVQYSKMHILFENGTLKMEMDNENENTKEKNHELKEKSCHEQIRVRCFKIRSKKRNT